MIGHPFDTIKIQQQVHGINFFKAVLRIQGSRGIRGILYTISFTILFLSVNYNLTSKPAGRSIQKMEA